MKEKEILDEIRRWLKGGCTIKAANKNGKVLEFMPDGSCFGGMIIVGENSRVDAIQKREMPKKSKKRKMKLPHAELKKQGKKSDYL